MKNIEKVSFLKTSRHIVVSIISHIENKHSFFKNSYVDAFLTKSNVGVVPYIVWRPPKTPILPPYFYN